MSVNFCTRCGQRLSGPARFCGSCGAPVAVEPAVAPPDREVPGEVRLPASPPIPSFAPPPVAAGRAAAPASPASPAAGRGALDSLFSLAPGLAIQLFQNGSAYWANPALAARFLLPCLLSVVSMALAPKLGKWVAVLVMLPALVYMLIPLLSGLGSGGDASGMVQAHAGRGLVSLSMVYMLMNLLRSRRR